MKLALITPPFTQFSSPYPALPFLGGYLKTIGVDYDQFDLSVEVMGSILSRDGLKKIFDSVSNDNISKRALNILNNKERYIEVIDDTMRFMRGDNPNLEYRIVNRTFLPEGSRFETLKNIKKDKFNVSDYSLLLCSLFIDDLVDFIKDAVSEDFGFVSYCSSIAGSSYNFDEINGLIAKRDVVTEFIEFQLDKIDFKLYDLVCITIPFPGNLISALKISRYVKDKSERTKITIGGGYVNTELRNIKNDKIFDFVDFISLDSGEAPLNSIIDWIKSGGKTDLIRTFVRLNGEIIFYKNDEKSEIISAMPDYESLDLTKYFSMSESTNVMHNIWSKRLFLKLRLAYGCYHHRCKFCDVTLDYIKNYKADKVDNLINYIKYIVEKLKINSFHFVDEAMPPNVVKKFCIEILKNKLNIVWWGNVRFDKAFDYDLCRLMAKSGCVAVSGGIESATDKMLSEIDKGFSLKECVKTCSNFTKAHILVHAYLIYGLPGETIFDTIRSLETIRQMFAAGSLNSAYYHRFSLTIYSRYYDKISDSGLSLIDDKLKDFANNDVDFSYNKFYDFSAVEEGINKAIFNFNYGNLIDADITEWFDYPIKKLNIDKNFVKNIAQTNDFLSKGAALWIGERPSLRKNKKSSILEISGNRPAFKYEAPDNLIRWLYDVIISAVPENFGNFRIEDLSESFPNDAGECYEDFLKNELWLDLRKAGLLIL